MEHTVRRGCLQEVDCKSLGGFTSGGTFGNGTLNVFKRHTVRPVLYFVLPQLLFCFAHVSQGRVTEGHPRNNAVVKWLQFLRKGILGCQFSLLIGNVRKL